MNETAETTPDNENPDNENPDPSPEDVETIDGLEGRVRILTVGVLVVGGRLYSLIHRSLCGC
jgi:hypothetical protein